MKSEEQYKEIRSSYKSAMASIDELTNHLESLAESFSIVGQDVVAQKLMKTSQLLNKNLDKIDKAFNEYENEIICVNSQLSQHLFNALEKAVVNNLEIKEEN